MSLITRKEKQKLWTRLQLGATVLSDPGPDFQDKWSINTVRMSIFDSECIILVAGSCHIYSVIMWESLKAQGTFQREKINLMCVNKDRLVLQQ